MVDALPGRRGARAAPVSLKAGRHGPQPHPGDPRRALRPLVEPGGRGPGHRPGLAHRPGPARAGAPAGHARAPSRTASPPCWQPSGDWPTPSSAAGEAWIAELADDELAALVDAGAAATRRRSTAADVRRTTWWGKAWVDGARAASPARPQPPARGPHLRPPGPRRRPRRSGPARSPRSVQGSRPTPYHVRRPVRRSPTPSGTACSTAIAARAAHAAALLDGELDPGIVDDAADGRRRPAARTGRAPAPLLVPRLGRPVQARRRRLLPGGRRARRRPVRPVPPAGPSP